MEESYQHQQPFQETKRQKIKRFLKETRRVLRITRKPNKEEFKSTAKATALGMAIIGTIGFLIMIVRELLF